MNIDIDLIELAVEGLRTCGESDKRQIWTERLIREVPKLIAEIKLQKALVKEENLKLQTFLRSKNEEIKELKQSTDPYWRGRIKQLGLVCEKSKTFLKAQEQLQDAQREGISGKINHQVFIEKEARRQLRLILSETERK